MTAMRSLGLALALLGASAATAADRLSGFCGSSRRSFHCCGGSFLLAVSGGSAKLVSLVLGSGERSDLGLALNH